MISSYVFRLVLTTALCGAFLAALTTGAAAQLKEQQNCINSINKASQKVAATQGKENSGCVKDFASAKLPPGQTAQQCLTADNKGKVSKAASKTITTHAVHPRDGRMPVVDCHAAKVTQPGISRRVASMWGATRSHRDT